MHHSLNVSESNFPPSQKNSNYSSLQIEYYEDFARSFDFTKYVRFQHQVISVEMAPNYQQTGRWIVKFINEVNPKPEEEIFDGVMICVGHHNVRNEPLFPGQEHFRGKVMHTHSLKTASGFEDKRVVVVGIGNSATDAAVEVSSVAKQVRGSHWN